MKTIRIGTRTSALALKQTEMVMQTLQSRYKDISFEVVSMKTKGDKLLNTSLVDFGGKGAFITEFEDEILKGNIDIAVHSAKDMPMDLAEGLDIWMALKRADARDVMLTRKEGFKDPGRPMLIGTGSPRRQIQMESMMDVKCRLLRGNVPTRIEKLRQGSYDGIILAAAGLERLGLEKEEDLCYRYLSYDEMIPAGGQGIVTVEGRQNDDLKALFEKCSDRTAELELETERYLLERLEAGCHEPVGVFSQIEKPVGEPMAKREIEENRITIRLLLEKNGKPHRGSIAGSVKNRLELADRLIEEVSGNGKK